jgi:hypothetical protein
VPRRSAKQYQKTNSYQSRSTPHGAFCSSRPTVSFKDLGVAASRNNPQKTVSHKPHRYGKCADSDAHHDEMQRLSKEGGAAHCPQTGERVRRRDNKHSDQTRCRLKHRGLPQPVLSVRKVPYLARLRAASRTPPDNRPSAYRSISPQQLVGPRCTKPRRP